MQGVLEVSCEGKVWSLQEVRTCSVLFGLLL